MSNVPPIIVPIQSHVVNAKEISDEIFNAFQAGLTKIMQSKKFAVGMRNVFKLMGTELEKSMGKSGTKMADQITKALNKIPQAAAHASSAAGAHLNNLVPGAAQSSVDRLIKQFDRLDKAVSSMKPSIAWESRLLQVNKQLARTTTEANRQDTAAQNSALQAQAAQANAAAKQRVAIIQAMANQIRAIERGLGQVIKFALGLVSKAAQGVGNALRGIGNAAHAGARASAAAMRTITAAMASVVRGVARLSAGLASGFARGFGRISSALVGALRRDEGHLRSSLSRRERMVSASASRQSSLLSRITSTSGLAALTGGVGLGSILAGGFERFSNLERLQFQYERLLGSSEAAKDMLEEISQFSRTTSFDLVGVAGLATNFLALGQSSDQVMTNIRGLADVVAFSGGTTDSLERIQRAMGQIISTGKLQGDELNQLAENLPGINIRQIIADQLGISTAELVKMQEAGELDAETFINAFLTGIQDPRFEGAAEEIATTLSGRLANLKETFDIFGASLVGLVADPLRNAMSGVTDVLNKVGSFISGEMFVAAENPFADMKPDAEIMFGDLPAEMQEILARDFGWDETNFISAADAAGLWEQLNPPDPMMEKLRELRDMIGDFAKGAGGFLAFAGGAKFLAAALRFLVSPLTIVTGLFGLLGVFWGRIKKASPDLRSALGIARQHFGALQTTLKETGRLVLGLVSSALFGDSDFFKNVGDRVSDFVNELGAGANQFRQWVDMANEKLAEGKFGEVIDSASQSIQGFLSNILGLTDAQLAAAQALGGNDFGNIFTAFLDKLEEVPILGPIVRFVRRVVDTISRAIGMFAGFVGDIWNSIFGGDEGPGGTLAAEFLGGDAQQKSIGTRIADTLENTFLGPVVRFFRGPFSNVIEGIGNWVGGLFNAIFRPEEGAEDDAIITRVADFLAANGLKGLVDWLRGDSLSQAYNKVKDFLAPAFETISGAIDAAWKILKPILEPMTEWVGKVIDAFRDRDFEAFDFGKIAIGAGIGLLAGAVVGGPLGAIAGAGIGAAFGGGLGGAIAATIGNAWTIHIQPALSGLWTSIADYVTKTFTADNIKSKGEFILEFLRRAGRLVAAIATDPIFVGAIAGVTAAAALVVIFFTLGIVEGLAKAIIEWSTLISDALEQAWESIAPDFIPEPIAMAISAALGSPSMGLLIGVGTIALGTIIVQSLIGGITAVGPALVNGAGGMFGMIFGKKPKTFGIGGKQTNAFKSVGTAIASSIFAGIAAFEIGKAAGGAGGTGNMILALLSGAGLGAAIGTSIAPGFGTTIGALLGVAAAAVGAFFGDMEDDAKRARQTLDDFTAALEMDGAAGALSALREHFVNLDASTRETLLDLNFDAGGFVQGVLDGERTVGESLQNMLNDFAATEDHLAGFDMEDTLNFTRVSTQIGGLGNDLQPLLTGLELLEESGANVEDLFGGVSSGNLQDFLDVLDASGISLDEFIDVVTFAQEQGIGLTEAMSRLGDAGEFDALVTGIDGVVEALDTAEEATQLLLDLFNQPNSVILDEAGIQSAADLMTRLLNVPGLGTEEKLEAINGLLEVMEGQVEETKTKLMDLIDAQLNPPKTREDVERGFRIDITNLEDQLAGIQEQVDQEQITAEAGLDLRNDALEGFGELASATINEAIEAGLITDPASFAGFVSGMNDQVDQALREGRISETTAAAMHDILNGITLSPEMIALFEKLANDQAVIDAANRAAEQLRDTIQAAFDRQHPITPGSFNTNAVLAGAITGGIATAVAPATTAVGTNILDIDKEAFVTTGEELNEFVGEGFTNNIPQLRVTISQAAVAAATGASDKNVSSAANTSGTKIAGEVARGMTSGKILTQIAGLSLGVAAKTGAEGFGGQMQTVGFNLSAAMARGINLGGVAAVIAAAQVARNVINTVRAILAIRSPSQVFVDIGQQVGAGFVEGIEASEASMENAITSAINNAIGAATDNVESATAKAGSAIFSALFPSQIPGGASSLDIRGIQGTQRKQIFAFWESMQSGAAGGFGNEKGAALGTASRSLMAATTEAWMGFADVVDDVNEALAQRDAINAWDAAMNQINRDTQSWAIGWRAYTAEQAEQQVQLNAGLITAEQYNDTMSDLNKKLQAGILNQEAYAAAVSDLGARPDILTREQVNLINSGSRSLEAWSIAGRANAEVVNASLQSVQDWATAALEAGYGVRYVADGTNYWVAQMQAQAAAAGLASADVNQLVGAMGLMPDQIAAWVTSMTSLDAWTRAGEDNVEMINEQLKALRDYGVAMLEAGFAANAVAFEVGAMRDELVRQATSFGFNVDQINALVSAAGLANDQLGEFVRQMQDFATEADRAAEAAARAKLDAEERALAAQTPVGRPIVENLNVYIPYGDPEAVGMAAANAIAYRSLTSW